jgi:hypothetical protein
MRTYSPRRQSKRWLDADCPQGVLAILDAGKLQFDRWTVIYRKPIVCGSYSDTWLGFRGMSDNPFHPQGVGLYGEMQAYQAAALRYRQRSAKWSTLPDAVKKCVRQDLEESAQ